MHDLFVKSEARGGGIGRKLIEACRGACRTRGVGKLVWQTAPDNETAQRLYDSTGAESSLWKVYELEGLVVAEVESGGRETAQLRGAERARRGQDAGHVGRPRIGVGENQAGLRGHPARREVAGVAAGLDPRPCDRAPLADGLTVDAPAPALEPILGGTAGGREPSSRRLRHGARPRAPWPAARGRR